MIDGNQKSQSLGLLQQCTHLGYGLAADAKVEKVGDAEDVRVALEGGDLASRDQQQTVEVGLHLAHRVEVRGRVVIGDGDKIQTASRRGLNCDKGWARNL